MPRNEWTTMCGISTNKGATNSSGFSALPGGIFNFDTKTFNSIGSVGNWWTSSKVDDDWSAYHRHMENNSSAIYKANWDRTSGLSVRCVKDE